MDLDWALGFGMMVTAILSAWGGLLGLSLLQSREAAGKSAIFTEQPAGTCFLFDGEMLVDATPGARALLTLGGTKGAPWTRLMAYLSPRFPGFETQLAALALNGRLTLTSTGDHDQHLMLRAEMRGGLTRITLLDPQEESRTPGHDPLTQRAMQDELDLLRVAVAQAPLLVWRETEAGEVTWANAAYLMQAMHRLDSVQDLTWPLPRLFDLSATSLATPGPRQRLDQPGGGSHWFDLLSFPDADGRLMFGQPADALVQAEGSLRDFMQTLTKTFAQLPIGLAIFDRQRQLALFNPALLDLTGLPPGFLSVRPSLFAFLDAMRDRNMIPEPKDYRSWRKQMTELEEAAASGLFEDTWSLASGHTYKVVGRPHPNGALALMFEDISGEITRMRRYRADLELGQAVMDAVDQALAVFSPAGTLVMANFAYAQLWDHDPAATLAEGHFVSLCQHWRACSAASPLWQQAEEYVATIGERLPLRGEVRLLDGRLLDCIFSALPGGATLASFRCPGPQPRAEVALPSFLISRHSKIA